jgi:hypothetical protein
LESHHVQILLCMLRMITLSRETDPSRLHITPNVPSTYMNEPHLNSFMNLVFRGLMKEPEKRPFLYEIREHSFL